jgi:hypothetical protein
MSGTNRPAWLKVANFDPYVVLNLAPLAKLAFFGTHTVLK